MWEYHCWELYTPVSAQLDVDGPNIYENIEENMDMCGNLWCLKLKEDILEMWEYHSWEIYTLVGTAREIMTMCEKAWKHMKTLGGTTRTLFGKVAIFIKCATTHSCTTTTSKGLYSTWHIWFARCTLTPIQHLPGPYSSNPSHPPRHVLKTDLLCLGYWVDIKIWAWPFFASSH